MKLLLLFWHFRSELTFERKGTVHNLSASPIRLLLNTFSNGPGAGWGAVLNQHTKGKTEKQEIRGKWCQWSSVGERGWGRERVPCFLMVHVLVPLAPFFSDIRNDIYTAQHVLSWHNLTESEIRPPPATISTTKSESESEKPLPYFNLRNSRKHFPWV